MKKGPTPREGGRNTLYVDTIPHGSNKVVNPNELDKPNILEREAYDEAIITNANSSQLNSKALFNVLRSLKKGCKCTITLGSRAEAENIAEMGKIAGFIASSVSGSTVTLYKS